MTDVTPLGLLAAFVGAFLAGAINAVAGGGTLVSFPVLVALGLPPVVANATNTVGVWSGAFGSIWGFRREIGRLDRKLYWFVVPALVGSLIGARLLRILPAHVFDKVVPWLLFLATFLLAVQGAVQRRIGSVQAAARLDGKWVLGAMLLQFGVAVYGGYFGAGMSIMALAILGLLGMTDPLEMAATTSLLGFVINGAAAVSFMAGGLIHWPCAVSMTVGALAGGYGASGVARKIGKAALRRFVVCVGAVLGLVLLARALRQ